MGKRLMLILSAILLLGYQFNLFSEDKGIKINKDGSVDAINSNKTRRIENLTAVSSNMTDWKSFRAQHGDWTVVLNKVTNTPQKAFGPSIQIEGYNAVTSENVEAAAMSFLRSNASLFNIDCNNLLLKKKVFARDRWYIGYVQTYNGIEVLNTEVELRIFKNGKVMAFGIEYYKDAKVNINPTISPSAASEAATYGISVSVKGDKTLSADKMYILPVVKSNSVEYKLVYSYNFYSNEPMGRYLSFVDAHDGKLLKRRVLSRNISTTIQSNGMVKRRTPLDEPSKTPMPLQYVKIGNTYYNTDVNGSLNVDITEPQTVTIKMNGLYGSIYSVDISGANYSGTLNPGENFTIEWTDDNSHLFERTLFYHSIMQHEYLKSIDPAITCMDFPIGIGIMYYSGGSYGTEVNAMSFGDSILFINAVDDEWRFAECGQVLYHEYGHSINAMLYEELLQNTWGMVNTACNEGTADVYAAFILDEPRVGVGSYIPDSNENIRNINNTNKYPDDWVGESHDDGMILSGAFWDLREMIGLDDARILAHYTKYGTPDDEDDALAFSAWFMETLVADDDDGDLSNGTPHMVEIITAFNNHNIGTNLITSMNFSHEPYPDTDDTLHGYDINFTLGASNSIISQTINNISVVWSTDNFVTKNTILAYDEGNFNYVAEIPAQKAGTIVQYYISANDIFTETEIKLSANASTFKAYQFLVGFQKVYSFDMETNPGWTIGESSDNSTTGIWEWGSPNQIISTWSGDTLQTRYVTSGTHCYATGAGGTFQTRRDYIPNGQTTLLSPVMDISNLNNPILKYSIWFFEDQYYNPSPSYFRIQVSSDGGSHWKIIESITETTNGWVTTTIDIDNYVYLTKQFQIRFVVNNLYQSVQYYKNYCDALLDDVMILSSIASPETSVEEDNKEAKGIMVYPNPAVDYTLFELPPSAFESTIKIYDLFGNEVKSLVAAASLAERTTVKWNCLNSRNERLAPGIYIYSISNKDGRTQGKIIIKDY